MKLRLLVLTFFICTIALAQNKGTVSGILTDKEANNATLPFANAMIKGTSLGATTDENGNYSLSIDPGTYTIVFSFLGYENSEETFTIAANQKITISKALGSGGYTLNDVVVKAQAVSREKETALLLDQKNAVEIKQNIGAQELARKGVSDVATAVSKTTGVTKEEGSGTIYVRGLGDRYNATTMNGLPIPSNDPERKNMNLENLSTDIVEYISIDKVYSSRLFGDFGGANVDIVSKNYQGKGFFRVEIGTNANTNSIGDKNFKLQKGQDEFGFSKFSVPQNALKIYSFGTLQRERMTPFAGNLGLSAGDSYNIGEEGKLSLFGTVSFTNEYHSKDNGSAASGISPDAKGTGNEDILFAKKYDKYLSYTYGTTMTAMGNIGYKFNNHHKLSFNTVYINSSAQSSEEYYGREADGAEDGNGLVIRNQFIKNTLFINQLLGDHEFSDRFGLKWGASHNVIDGDMPDRNTTRFFKFENQYYNNAQSAANNNRYYQTLTETETAANAAFDYKIGKTAEGEYNGKITLGYAGKFKDRDLEAVQFNVKGTNNALSDPNNLDTYFNQQNFATGLFVVSTFRGNGRDALDPQFYTGDQTVHSGFANIDYTFGTKFTASVGFRADIIEQTVTWNTSLQPETRSNTLEKNAFLPNVILKYELNDKQNLRFAFSKTYTLPQFKERALFIYEEVNAAKQGNPYLYASDNYNVDLKWELFPKSEELISVTAFGKYILNPINETTINSSTNDISYVNSGDTGYALGVEVEYRKSLFATEEENSRKLSAGLNASYMYTDQELDSDKVKRETNGTLSVDFTNEKGQFTGASPVLINADLTFVKEWNQKDSNLSATIAYNYFSDRVYALGTGEKGDLVDKAVGTLDFILKSKLNKNLGLGLAVKNILDPTVKTVQENAGGDVNVFSYTKGLNLSLGLNYQF